MRKVPPPDLGLHVQAFFADYMTTQRALSPHTILSYRDTFRLFLVFAARRARTSVADLSFEQIDAATVLAFLEDLERNRNNSARTRNARLAALHTFFRYVAIQEPRVLATCQQINAIPVKKTQTTPATYLEHDEVAHILATIDRSKPLGRRDHLLLHLLFETGARAHEIATLRTTAFRLDKPCQVQLFGKGRKERICPLRTATAKLVRAHLGERRIPTGSDAPLFVSACGEPLTRHGVLRVVQRCARKAGASMPRIAQKRIGAHTFRHSAAIHLLRAGNALPVIRSWLGHVSVTTTDHYTEIDTEVKRRAVEGSQPLPASCKRPSWARNPDLLAWLEAL